MADPEGAHLNPPLRTYNFIFMGIFKKSEVKSANQTSFIHLNSLSRKPYLPLCMQATAVRRDINLYLERCFDLNCGLFNHHIVRAVAQW